MHKKTVFCLVASLLLLQLAGLSLASETAEQNSDNQQETDTSPTTNDGISNAAMTESKSDNSEASPSVSVPQEGEEEEEENEKSGRLIAQYTTKTKALFVTTTRTALSTCFSATNTACTTRRKKRSMVPRSLFIGDDAAELATSQFESSSEERSFEPQALDSDRNAKKFTIWTTLFSTHTLTTTFYYPGTTVTVSGVCSVAGLDSSCFG